MATLLFCTQVVAEQRWALESWEPPFDYEGRAREILYQPLRSAAKKWHLCAAYPHMKDPYWLSVNYGMVEQATRLGVSLQITDAGGYPNLEKQSRQIRDCVAEGADALIVGTVSFDRLTPTLKNLARTVPVIAAVNDIRNEGIAAKAAVSWVQMGRRVGEYLAARHPKGSAPARIAWFPGPRNAGWVGIIDRGFREGIAGGAIELVAIKWGDTGKAIQRNLIQEMLQELSAQQREIDYIVGTALTAEAAISELQNRGLAQRIGIIATYFTHGVFRGIKRGRILAAPTDSPVLQGRLAVDQAVRLLEGKALIAHAGPKIRMVERDNLERFDPSGSLAPSTFLPTFRVE